MVEEKGGFGVQLRCLLTTSFSANGLIFLHLRFLICNIGPKLHGNVGFGEMMNLIQIAACLAQRHSFPQRTLEDREYEGKAPDFLDPHWDTSVIRSPRFLRGLAEGLSPHCLLWYHFH